MTPRVRLRPRFVVPAVLAAVAVGVGAPSARADDRQPVPPRIFFPEPDAATTAEIATLVENSFGDVNKAPVARDVLVRRFGLWAVAPLLARIEKDANGTIVWNSILTIGSLRRVLGPSPHLWPAVPVLTKVLRGGGEPTRRAFAALALGEFYGPDLARIGPGSRDGTREGWQKAQAALTEGAGELAARLLDGEPTVQTAATLALGKIGGPEAGARLLAFLHGSPGQAHWAPRAARLLAAGLLLRDDEGLFVAAVKDAVMKNRAGAALGVALWAVAHVFGEGTELPATALARAAEFDAVLDPVRNTAIRGGEDGAEAIFARGALAHVSGRADVWSEIYAAATTPSTEAVVAVAAAQALMFAPRQSSVRRQIAELIARPRSGLQREPAVVAGFLRIAGSDGTPVGVRACREFLANKARDPRGRADWDVRFYAVLGLCEALEAGRVESADRIEAIDAIGEATRTLVPGEPGARTFRSVLEEVLGRGARDALASDAGQRLPDKARSRLVAAFADPDAMAAVDPIDAVLDRLNDQVWLLFGLDGVKPAATGGVGGPRQPRTDDEPERFLMGWLTREPYFTRVDLHRARGVVVAARMPADPSTEIDR